jgi:multidrug efflux pump
VIGGMLAATFLAILFVPMLFKLVTRERNAGVPAMSPETSGTG